MKPMLYGLNRIEEVVAKIRPGIFDLKKYYTKHISYIMDENKKKGLRIFLHKTAKEKTPVWQPSQ